MLRSPALPGNPVMPIPLEIVARFLSEVVRFLSASALWCAAAQMMDATFGMTQMPYGIRSTAAIPYPVHYVAATDEETVVVSFGFEPGRNSSFYRQITKISPAGEDEPLRVRIPFAPGASLANDPLSEGLFVTGTDWWYATLDIRDGAAATTFVKSDGSRATYVRPPAFTAMSWQLVILPGEKPRAIELTYRAEETIAREVDWKGEARTWRLPPVSHERRRRMIAQPLPDGRIALLSNHDGLALYLLADDGRVDAMTLRNVTIHQFDAAIDPAGLLAIVAARNASPELPDDIGTIEVAIVDPTSPEHAEWRALRHDVRVIGHLRDVQVVATPDGFAAAWINELAGRRIEAAGVDRRGHGGPVVDVGQARVRGDASLLGVQARQDELLFWWDDGEHLLQRRLPVSLSGYAMVNALAQRFCREDGAQHQR
jgi:hypothetical protein